MPRLKNQNFFVLHFCFGVQENVEERVVREMNMAARRERRPYFDDVGHSMVKHDRLQASCSKVGLMREGIAERASIVVHRALSDAPRSEFGCEIRENRKKKKK